jgi:hypothetical protein
VTFRELENSPAETEAQPPGSGHPYLQLRGSNRSIVSHVPKFHFDVTDRGPNLSPAEAGSHSPKVGRRRLWGCYRSMTNVADPGFIGKGVHETFQHAEQSSAYILN